MYVSRADGTDADRDVSRLFCAVTGLLYRYDRGGCFCPGEWMDEMACWVNVVSGWEEDVSSFG